MRKASTERWWWLGGFLLLSVLIHLFLALHGPGFGLKGGATSSKEIELTLEPLPPEKKPPTPKLKVAARPKPQPKPYPVKEPPKVAKATVRRTVRPKPTPKLALRPVREKPVTPVAAKAAPQLRAARVMPALRPAAPARTGAPEKLPEQAEPVRVASVTPRVSHAPSLLDRTNPLAGLTTPEDRPEAASSAHADTPKITRIASARTGLAGGASGGGHSAARGAQTPTDQPQDSGLAGGMHFPKMAARLGGESIMSVPNPLAEDAVPEEKPGFSAGAGGGPGLGRGRGRGGLDGKLLASLRGGHGPGLGGGIGGGRGAGSGRGSGRGRGAGHGTGAGASGSGTGDGLDLPGGGDGYGHGGIGSGAGPGGTGHGTGGGRRVAGGGGAFGDVGGLLRGEPARTPGDGHPGTGGHGLSAEIYEGRPYLAKRIGHRTDAAIDFNWGMTAAVIPGASRLFSVRWTGKIQPKYSEIYTFASQEDDGLKLWVDGQPLISDWEDHKLTARRGSIRLEAGRKYEIKIEYFNGPMHARNGLGHAEVHLRWASPSQPLQIVPQSALYQAE